jgi:ABC-2 type transport system ATP-binding protein
MTVVLTAAGVTKRYGRLTALDDVGFALTEGAIHGLLGRNGVGKTTLMRILTGQEIATAGRVEVFGRAPYEDETALSRVCFVRESQRYPTAYRVRHVLRTAAALFPRWDDELARALVARFGLPLDRHVRKLSRGMLSALGVTVGLASRAPLTFFDEPYLGLDAVARQLFYDRLLADYAAHPRTVVLSTHLIDEVGDLVERVLLLDRGRLVLDEDAERLRGRLVVASGPAAAVDGFAAGLAGATLVRRDRLGGLDAVRATLRGAVGPADRDRARELGVELAPLSLQQLVVSLTAPAAAEPGPVPATVGDPR